MQKGGVRLTAYLKLKTNNEEIDEQIGQETKTHPFFCFWKQCFFQFVIFIKFVFHVITIKQIYGADILIFPFSQCHYPKGWERKRYNYHLKQCIRKLKKLMKKEKINRIVLADELKNDEYFLQHFITNQEKQEFTILNGKNVFFYLLLEIIQFILEKQHKHTNSEDIYVLLHHNKQAYLDNILFLLQHFKTVNIVTDNLKPFQLLAEKVEAEEGIQMTVSNNKRKSLRKAKIIINFDFAEEELSQYVIYRNAIFIHVGNSLSYENQTFGGVQIQRMEIDTSKEIKQLFQKYHLLESTSLGILYEGILNQNENFQKVRKQIEKDQVKILSLYGKNGLIDSSEYKRINFE